MAERIAAHWMQRADLARLNAALGPGQARYVGGAVRDTLLGVTVKDIDVATPLDPHEVMRRLKAHAISVVPTGIDHGTVTAVLPGGPVEITTLRRDVSTDGRHATVAFSDSWQEDAARRDSPSTRSMPIPKAARSAISSAVWPISTPAGCASSGMPASASARIICGSCVTSGFKPGLDRNRLTRKRNRPA